MTAPSAAMVASAPAAPAREAQPAEHVVATSAVDAPVLTPLRAMFLALAGVLTLASAVRLMMG